MKIGDRIRQLRDERGVTAEQLAVRIGRGSQTLLRWEWGKTSPRVEDLGAIAAALGIELALLLEGVTEDVADRGAA